MATIMHRAGRQALTANGAQSGTAGMWEQYKKTVIPIQLFIVTACLTAHGFARVPWIVAAAMFVVMQIGAMLGALWAVRRQRRVEARDAGPAPRRRT